MRITNFRYANHTLKYYGFMVCSFDKNGIQTNSNGSEIEFKTTPLFNGKQQYLTSSNYKNCITAEIDICPIPNCENNTDTTFVTVEQERNIMKWLNRKEFHKFKIVGNSDYADIYFNGSFNVEKVTFDNAVIGFHLTFTADRPFAVTDRNFTIDFAQANTEVLVEDTSDESGSQWLNVEISIPDDTLETDELIITHRFGSETESVVIKNCSPGETIWLYYPMSASDLSTHKISRDFNYHFLKISKTESMKENYYSCNIQDTLLSCSYSPVVKIGL